jgi:tetratricopeptide (TPR) repeat protein
MRKLVLLLACLLCGDVVLLSPVSSQAQTARLQTREAQWKNYALPPANFARHVIAENRIVFRVPAEWKQNSSSERLTFVGPHSSALRVLVQDVPEGYPLGEYFGTVLQGVKNMPGATEGTLTRRTQFQDLEARELVIEAPEPGGEMIRSTTWITIVGPLAVTFNLQVPVAHAAEVEPFFKATVQSVIFTPNNFLEFAHVRDSFLKMAAPAPINEVENIVAELNLLDSNRESAISRLTLLFSSSPDAVVDLLLDRRETVRSAAVEALARSRNVALKPLLWHVVGDANPLVAEPAARVVAQTPDVVEKLLAKPTPRNTIETAAGLWRFLSPDNRWKVLQRAFGAVEFSQDPRHKFGALALLNMTPAAEFKLPLAQVLAANDDRFTIGALQTARNRGESLPVDSLLKLTSSTNETIKKLAIENLGLSAGVADIPKIESLKGLDGERKLAVKQVRLRNELSLVKNPEAMREIVRKAVSDSSLADFAWRFDCEPTAVGCSSVTPKRLPDEFKVKPFAENLLPKKLRHYIAIPNPGQGVQKFYETLHGLQLDSPRAQSNLILVMGTLREKLGEQLGAPPDAPALIEYTGIKPDTPIVMASWTAAGARETTSLAQRHAIVLRIKDRPRFELVLQNLEQGNGSILPWVVDYFAVGTRLVAALPAALPLGAKEMLTRGPEKPKSVPVTKHSFVGQSEWNGIPIKTLDYLSIDPDGNVVGSSTYLAFVGDTAILAPDVATIRDLLTNATAGEQQSLAANDEFRRATQSDGDVVYFSDLTAVFPDQEMKEPRPKADESGALKFSNSTWENSHRLAFNESHWSKPLASFQPKELTAPRELLPASTLAYYLMKLDMAAAWQIWPNILNLRKELSEAHDLWNLDLQRDVLPELGPECGLALLEFSGLSLSDDETWAAFCKLKTNKLSDALTAGKLFSGVGPTSDIAEVKFGKDSYFVTTRRGFLVVSNRKKALASLADKTNLAATRDYSRAAERAPAGVVAFGGYNLEASVAAASAAMTDGLEAQQAAMAFSVASAFHSQSFFATATPQGIEGRSSVAMDREGRYAVSDLSYLPKGANITLAAVEARGLPITDQNRISSLVLKIRAKASGPIDSIREDIKSAHQTVEQKSANELLVKVAARRSNPEKKIQLPVSDPQFAQFLKSSGDIASDDPNVIARAKEIAGDDRDAWSVARKLANWTHENLKWKYVASAGAGQTLASREADCSEFSELFVAMARSLGLPARTVSGLAHSGSTFGGHAWVEVWAGEWIEMDPTWGTDFVDATHIRNSSSALVTSAALNLIDFEIVEANRTIAEFQKTPRAFAEHLIKAIPEGDRSDLEAAIDLETLTDEYMGAGAWKGLNENERDQMSSAYRRVLGEIVEGYRKTDPLPNDMHLLHVEEKDDRAEAWCLDARDDMLLKLRFARREGAWRLVEVVQADTGLHIAAEMTAPAIKSIEAARAGKKEAAAGLSDFVRALLLFDTDPSKAVEVMDRALQAKPSDRTLRYLKALALLMLDKQDEGVKLLTELSNEQPAHAQAIFKLAEVLGEDKPAEAIELYKRYTSLEPYDPRGYRELGLLYDNDDQVKLAEETYRKWIAIDPIEVSGHLSLIRLLALNDRIPEVGALMVAADRYVGPDEDVMASVLDDLYDYAKLEEAQKLADSEPQRMRTSVGANLALSNIYMREKRYREALTLINRALQIDPKVAETHVALSAAYVKLSRFAEALKAANQAVSLNENSADAHYQRARVLARLGRTKEALAALEKMLELSPTAIAWIEDAPELKSLRNLPAFKKLLQEYKTSTSTEPN